MKKLALAAFMLFAATSVCADDWNEKSVAGVMDQIKSGKGLYEAKEYSSQQIVVIRAPIRYYIDVKAKLCFAGDSVTPTVISCKALKEGYPLLTPIISWEK